MQPTDEIDIHSVLRQAQQIAAIWSIEDVHAVRPDLTDDQAWKVLQVAECGHDADFGINWQTLETIAEDLFGEAPKADEARS